MAAPTVEECLERWKQGTSMSALKAETKIPHLMTKIIALLGGKAAFKSARAAGAGGRGFGGQERAAAAPVEPPNDSKVRVVTSTKVADGWNTRTLAVTKATVLMFKDGTEYVEALVSEKADLIVKSQNTGTSRWKVLATSAAGRKENRKQKKEDKLLAHAEKSKAAKKVRRKK